MRERQREREESRGREGRRARSRDKRSPETKSKCREGRDSAAAMGGNMEHGREGRGKQQLVTMNSKREGGT